MGLHAILDNKSLANLNLHSVKSASHFSFTDLFTKMFSWFVLYKDFVWFLLCFEAEQPESCTCGLNSLLEVQMLFLKEWFIGVSVYRF